MGKMTMLLKRKGREWSVSESETEQPQEGGPTESVVHHSRSNGGAMGTRRNNVPASTAGKKSQSGKRAQPLISKPPARKQLTPKRKEIVVNFLENAVRNTVKYQQASGVDLLKRELLQELQLRKTGSLGVITVEDLNHWLKAPQFAKTIKLIRERRRSPSIIVNANGVQTPSSSSSSLNTTAENRTLTRKSNKNYQAKREPPSPSATRMTNNNPGSSRNMITVPHSPTQRSDEDESPPEPPARRPQFTRGSLVTSAGGAVLPPPNGPFPRGNNPAPISYFRVHFQVPLRPAVLEFYQGIQEILESLKIQYNQVIAAGHRHPGVDATHPVLLSVDMFVNAILAKVEAG